MKLPIPNDWNGADWQCVQIQWPASVQYSGVLLGLLSSLTRGWLYDEKTGIVTDAQAVGWQIWERNYPLVNCEGQPIVDDGPEPQNGVCGLFQDESEDYAMPCLDLTGLIKIEDGVLYVKDSCCNWQALGTLEGVEGSIPPSVLDGQLPVGQDANACGRAYAVWDTIIQTAHAVWDHHLDAPWFTIGNIKSAAPTNLTTSGIWIAVSQAILTDTVWGGDDIFNPTKLQQVLCEMLPRFEATTEKLSDDEWDAAYQAFRSFGNVTDIFIQNFYTQIAQFAITRDRLSNVAQAGALNNAQDCRCPDEQEQTSETTPDENGWYLGVDIHSEVTYTAPYGALWNGTIPHDVYGVFMRISVPPAADPTKRMSAANFHDAHPELMPAIDKTAFADTSDHLEVANLAYPIIQTDSAALAVSLTAQRGFMGATRLTSGIDGTIIASPEWLASETGGLYISSQNFGDAGKAQPGFVLELRWIHNTNSPSHA